MMVLLRKELRELRRTWRFVFLPLLFVVFGIAGPVFIRLLPALMESAQAEMQITLPEMTPGDALVQFFSLSRQMGLLAVILLFMGILAGERREGLLTVLFVKPVSRLQYVGTRWLVNGLYVLGSVVLGAAVALLYTALLVGPPHTGQMVIATALFLSYVLLCFSWTVCFSALVKSPPAAAGLSLLPLFVLPVLGSLWEPLGTWGPYGAVRAADGALGAASVAPAPIEAAAVASGVLDLGLSLVLVGCAYLALRRAEL